MKLRILAVALLVLSAGIAVGQVLYGTLVGTITDPQQAAVVGATVSIKNNATGYTVETKTNDRGAYEIPNIPPGVYDIRISMSGFSTFEAKGIDVQANNIERVDAPMKLGSVSEVITVGAEVVLLQTDKSDVHTDLTSKQLTDITIGGYRNFQSVINLIPGVTPPAFQNASTDSPARALTMNVNGTARNSNNTRIDGAASVFTWLPHHSYYIPPIESIDTVNVSTNNFDAEQGMAGGAAVSVITKSGSNQYHGVMFEYNGNHFWGAKQLFFNPNTPAGPNTPERIDNQFGGTFGGPIKHDKLFFFASWEGTTTAERGNGLLSVPVAQLRNGNFNGFGVTIYDPSTGDGLGQGRTPFAGNLIPANRMSQAAVTLQNLIPLPNTGTGLTANYFASAPYFFQRHMVDGKVNWTPNSKMNVFGKYSAMIAPVTASAPLGQALGAYPGGAAGDAGIGTGHNHTDIYTAGVSYVLTPTLLFDAAWGLTRMHHDTNGPDFGKNIGLDVLHIPGTNGSDPRQSGFPIFNISGYTGLGNQNNWSPVVRNDQLGTYSANLNWTKGSHSIRFGADILQHHMNHWQPEIGGWSPRGGFNFVSGVTANNLGNSVSTPTNTSVNAYAAFLLGLPGSMGKSYQFYDPMQTREVQQGYYVRDNWHITRKLNVNLGIRLEHFPIMNRGQYGIERYDITTNKVLIGDRGNVPRDAGTQAIPAMFGPRIGLAYRFGEKTVFRAGFGITNDPYPMSRPLRSPYPAVISFEFQPPNSFTPAGSLAAGIPAATFPDLSTGIIDIPNNVTTNTLLPGKFRRGYIESYNVTIQRELPGGFVLQTGYVGTHSVRQAVTYFNYNAGLIPGAGVNGRQLFSRFGVGVDRNLFLPMANQRYDSLQSNLTKRFSHGFGLVASYTWSKAIGINAGNSDSGLRFYVPSQFSKNRAVADFDRTHTFTSALNYELPFGKGKPYFTSGPASWLIGGWQINLAGSIYSGLPFIVTADGSSLNAPANTQVADQIKPTVTQLEGVGQGNPFYDPTAFAPVTTARFGNMGLNALRGPGLFQMNAGVFRKFAITERWELQFRGEAFNATNTPVLSNPNANVSTPSNFMAITSIVTTAQAPQRIMRFGLRLSF